MIGGATQQLGRVGDVVVDGTPLMLVPGTYMCRPADALAPQINQGAAEYPNFNQDNDSPWAAVQTSGGYGLRRYADRSDDQRRAMYLEARGVDARYDGQVTLGPEVVSGTTFLESPVIWIGQFEVSGTVHLIVVAGLKVFELDPDTLGLTELLTLPNIPLPQAVGVFGTRLVFGYGADHTAQYTSDLSTLGDVQDDTPTSLYAWAFTSDRAAAYIAGGTAVTDWYKVTSSADGATAYSDTLTVCGSAQTRITTILPGGGVAILFVLKENELGVIGESAVYRTLVPFDTRYALNGVQARWWLGLPDEQQRGPLVIFFPRDRGLWSYQPSAEASGTAMNVSPWAGPGIHPLNARGSVTAIQGSARYLYYVIQGTETDVWMNVKDARTGADHNYIHFGDAACQAMYLYQSDELAKLLFGRELHIAGVVLPLDGESPADNPNVRYTDEGLLTYPIMEWDLPDEVKIPRELKIVASNLVPASRYIVAQASYDGGGFFDVGAADTDGTTTIPLPGTPIKALQVRVTLHSDDNTESPILRAVVARATITPKTRRVWEFRVKMPAGSTAMLTDDTQNIHTTTTSLWAALSSGAPVMFIDRWGDRWLARVTALAEQATIKEPDRTPEWSLAVRLLEVSPFVESFRWDVGVWDDAASIWS